MHKETVHIAYVEISPRMAEKLASKHKVTADEVREAFQLPGRPQRGVWHNDPRHGRRLYIRGSTHAGRPVLGILKLVDKQNDHWRLRSAWPIDG
jgi:hypothetical protein